MLDTGVKISLSAHVVLLAFAVFGGQLFQADEAVTVQISEVSLLTGAEFSALQVPAPSAVDVAPEQPQPAPSMDQVAILDAPIPPSRPKTLTPPKAPELSPDPEPVVPVLEPLTQPPTPAPLAEDQAGEVKPEPPKPDEAPAPSPRVADQNNPEPATDAKPAKVAEQASVDAVDAPQPVEPTEEKAPKQSSTKIVTEAEIVEKSAAPTKSVRPKSRPKDLAARRPDPEPVDASPSINDLMAAVVAETVVAEAPASTAKNAEDGPGDDMTGSQKDALAAAVGQCWNVDTGAIASGDTIVEVEVRLSSEGNLISRPKLVNSQNSNAKTQVLFDKAVRALHGCKPFKTVEEMGGQARNFVFVFNPEGMVGK